jgi:hypothetical protein
MSTNFAALRSVAIGTELPNRNVRFDGEFRRISRHTADGAGRPSLTDGVEKGLVISGAP